MNEQKTNISNNSERAGHTSGVTIVANLKLGIENANQAARSSSNQIQYLAGMRDGVVEELNTTTKHDGQTLSPEEIKQATDALITLHGILG